VFDAVHVAEKLRKLRLEKFGENVYYFQRQSGVSRGTVENVEKKKGFPTLPVLAKWLGACRVTFAHFFEEFEPFAEPPMPTTGHKRQHKRYHDELEFVLNAVGPQRSATVLTLKLEYEKLRDSKKLPPSDPPARRPDTADQN
jgi:transcriptional regulator with XRE-family HTH domain